MEKKEILSNVGWQFGERLLAQVVSLLVSIVLARMLLPEDYGAVSMVTIFVAFADVLVSSGFASSLIQKKESDAIDFSSVFFLNLAFSIVLYIVLFVCAPYIAEFFHMPILKPVVRVLGIRVIITALNSVQHAYVSRNMMFKKYFWATLLGTLISCAVGLAMAYNGMGVWALVSQTLTNSVIDTIVLLIIVNWHPTLQFSWKRIVGLYHYGWKILVEAVCETFTEQLRNLIIGRVYTSEDLGYYTKAQQFPNILMDNVCVSISSVLFPVMSKIQSDESEVTSLMRQSIRLSSYILFPMMMGLALVAEPMIRIVLTDKWIDCVPYIRIFCFTKVATVGMINRHQALKSIGRSDVFMYEHFIYRIIAITILLSVYRISVMAIAYSLVVGTFVMIVTVMYTSMKYNGYKIKDQIMDILPTVIACIVMAVPVYFVSLINASDWVVLILQIVTGVVTYIAFSAIFKLKIFSEVLTAVKKFLGK